MKRRLRKIWRASWIVTLPIALCFVFWARQTYTRWHAFTLRHWTSEDLSFRKVGALELEHMARDSYVALTNSNQSRRLAATGLETIHLFVPEGSMQRLDRHLPHSGFDYVEGGMLYDGSINNVEVRYRGDNVYHWGYWKKSWRVKTKRGSLYKGMRLFNLVAPRTPELLNNYLSYRLASHMGLIAPETQVVNVALNGELQGLFILTEQLEESTVRRHGLMPGDVYSGELVGLDAYLGIPNALFDLPGAWTKVAINNHFDEQSLDPLRALLREVQNSDSPGAQQRLEALVDMEAFGRFSAFEALACTVHIDSVHNWRLYYDPWRTNFVPIVWDPVGWHRTMIPRPQSPLRPDVVSSPLHVALFRNADFLRARSRAFNEFFAAGHHKAFMAEAHALAAALPGALALDPNAVAEVELLSPAEIEAAVAGLLDTIESLFEQLRAIHVEDRESAVRFATLGNGRYAVEVRGRRPIEDLSFQYDASVIGPVSVRVICQTQRGTEDVDLSGAAHVTGTRIVLGADLLSLQRPSVTTLEPSDAWRNGLVVEPGYYEVVLAAPQSKARLVDLRVRRAGSDLWETAQRVSKLDPIVMGRMHSLVDPTPAVTPLVWSGEVELEGDTILERDLVISAGTTVRLAPDANLLVKGRVLAEGNKAHPIQFVPRDEGQAPWGVVAIKGPAANGSRFTFCNFRGGSGWKLPLAEYSAMFSVHDARNVFVVDCEFEDSQVVDDMVHGVYADMHFLRCTFRRSLFDALDMDISTVTVADCLFENSGNDSIDLMTTHAVVTGTRFVDGADKGISVGEDSLVVAQDCLMLRCEIGIQAKDESTAVLVNTDLIDCKQAVDAYKKNWRYSGGGEAYLYKCRLIGNLSQITADSNSKIGVADTGIDQEFDVKPKRIALRDDVDADTTAKARTKGLERFPAEVEALGEVGKAIWSKVDASRRGSTHANTP